ncbi:dienelactone hydrolase family protein [Crenobacter sp. SG2303]|uniref:Dienelactone hydrolase family protein n=1 Tax=Crenobacter oryzisoli TaxID=3056844 RepID=A0ABT7XP29_9NEIS|nr:dienelactone hydrolase family protein [Crenobacter sp. SG2303]MDN0075443.1 dienelactone hydrolase family protein [Crenobacter sp. SG2303]
MPPTPTSPPSPQRRRFLGVMIASGFALAVQPISAATIHTDSEGLLTGSVAIPTKDGSLPAYFARPNRTGPLPVVLVVQEVFGVHEHIQDLCRRLAKAGYLAVAPELYFRQGDPRKYPDISQLINQVVSKVPDEQVLADLDATLAWAGVSGGDVKRAAITGFCWGGRIVWLYSAHNPNLRAAAAWYGRLVGDKTPLTPRNPIDLVASLQVPVLGLYGGQDSSIPVDSIEKMQGLLKAAGNPSQVIVYPEAGHGFNADYRPSYNEAAAQDGWAKMLAWFAEHGAR